ncbi:mechanosensitive ion channel domain-containing protein [Marinobacter sp. CHS3-4]|uniref:mechanosensitive ion channel family protein n=1 Tax=Marinobacter sp. CHS3-4 TaxID=3045174 RepID=UPI0024B490F5|nr:mechanosensitive ion channel domain-containing protein [Marinobacter sp. CHS3-4]MDI9244753.1 mechanosensitive ion channel [Marinobacter sp. CHS3-4]
MVTTVQDAFAAWLTTVGYALFAVFLAIMAYKVLVYLLVRFFTPASATRMFFNAAAPAIWVSLCLFAVNGVLHSAPSDLPLLPGIQQLVTLLLVGSLTWAAVCCTSAIGEVIVKLNPALEGRWKKARKVETQTRFLVRGLNIVIVLIGTGLALMTFDSVRQIGTSLLASAGVGGIILGFAARPVLSNLLAGMQIALTQPLRIDDVVYVQNEWCWVEEVTATYVVLRVWDLRRLVVPLQWFIENPFQNWSRNSSDLIGSALIWVDYSIPIDPLREEFARLLRASADWDGVTETVQVVDAGDKAMQIRFLMSAKDSSALWNLRCEMREGLIRYIQHHYPEHLPRIRAQMLESDIPTTN